MENAFYGSDISRQQLIRDVKTVANKTKGFYKSDDHRDAHGKQVEKPVSIAGWELCNINFTAALIKTMAHMNLSDCQLRHCIFRDVDLSFCKMIDADLKKSDFRGANLTGALMIGCDCIGANFDDAILTDAIIIGCRDFDKKANIKDIKFII